MDQEESYPQEELQDQNYLEPEYQEQENVTVAPPLEGAFSKYLKGISSFKQSVSLSFVFNHHNGFHLGHDDGYCLEW